MFSLHLPLALNNLFSTSSFVGGESGAARTGVIQEGRPASAPMPALVSAYDDPPADLDQRVRAMGEW